MGVWNRGLVLAVVLCWGGAASLQGDSEAPPPLSPQYREWLEEVSLLITREERQAFLALDRDYQRDGFIDAFWEARGHYWGVSGQTVRQWHRQRLEEAKELFGSTQVDQARVYILHGEPRDRLQTDCGLLLWPVDIWAYRWHGWLSEFLVLFYQPAGGGPYRMWHPEEGLGVLTAAGPARSGPLLSWRKDEPDVIDQHCIALPPEVEKLRSMLRWLELRGEVGVRAAQMPHPVDTEWLRSFRALSTEVAPGAPTFSPELTVAFPGRSQERVVARATVELPSAELPSAELPSAELPSAELPSAELPSAELPSAELPSAEDAQPSRGIGRAFELYGEVLRQDRLHERFRYRFELPPASATEPSALVFDRLLRPGEYTLIVRIVEAAEGRQARLEQRIEVPALERAGTLAHGEGRGEPDLDSAAVLRLIAPEGGPHVGGIRIEAVVGSPVHRVDFLLDGRPLLTKAQPPYSIELALGRIPRTRTLRAVGLGEGGEQVAVDELVLNPAPHAFSLRLVEPLGSADPGAPLPLRVEAVIPEGRALERVELFVEDRQVATLYQPPWFHQTTLPEGAQPLYVRALGHLDDGATAEHAAFLQGDAPAEELDVHLVEVYATVLDSRGRPVHDLEEHEVQVFEDGVEQTLLRFERVRHLPLHLALLVDVSASMEPMLAEVQAAALELFDSVLAAGDRGAVMTFSEVPRLASPFTEDRDQLALGLAGLVIDRGTALWDSLMYAFHYFQGLQGQRALVVLSDGEDHHSRHRLGEVLEYARHAGVTVYAIDFGIWIARRHLAGRHLARLAGETGGRSFLPQSHGGVAEIYRIIEEDLRSRYLLVYQSPSGKDDRFRQVEVKVLRPAHGARHMAGYSP